MKLGKTITIADMKNLSKDGPYRISCFDFIILMTFGENEELFVKLA